MLLLGDATYDFKIYHGTEVENHVPPLIIETGYLHTVSDPTSATVNGDDRLLDLVIGRLLAASVDEVRTMLEKSSSTGITFAWEMRCSRRKRPMRKREPTPSLWVFIVCSEILP